jgi:hypothetical protein
MLTNNKGQSDIVTQKTNTEIEGSTTDFLLQIINIRVTREKSGLGRSILRQTR